MSTTPAPAPAAPVPGCPHVPQCPAADAVDHDAARVVGYDHSLSASRLCNGVLIWTDGGELVPDGPAHCHAVAPHRGPAPHCANPDHAHCCADDARWAAVDAAGRAFETETKEAA